MHKLKSAAAVAAMVGGIGLTGGGIAHAGDGPYPDVAIKNLQTVKCEQAFEPNTSAISTGAVTGGDAEANIGSFCTVIGEVEG
jgi:hypothetical protein